MFSIVIPFSSKARIVSTLTQTGVGTNSIWFLYKPEVPKSLRK
ncbi:cyclic lactone autoinducer peptide [Desulfitibacter alkalitolerans]